MDTRKQVELNTLYDIAGLVEDARKNLRNFIIQIAIYGVLLSLSILSIIFFGSYMLVFVSGIILACVSAFLGSKLIKKFSFADYSSACGEIVDVHKEIKIVRTTKVGGINPFGVRKYDHDGKNEVRLGVFLKEGEQVRGCFFNDGTEEHAKYYDARGKAIHIWGTHFPVKLDIGKEKWLCPICGEFNANEEKICIRCKNKILK